MTHANPSGLHAEPMQMQKRAHGSGYCHRHPELGHTGVRDHNEIPQHQSRRNSTAGCGEGEVRLRIPKGQITNIYKKSARTTRFFFSPSISNNSPGMGNELWRCGEQNGWIVLYLVRREPSVYFRETRALLHDTVAHVHRIIPSRIVPLAQARLLSHNQIIGISWFSAHACLLALPPPNILLWPADNRGLL